MKLWIYYLLSWLGGILTLVFSVVGAAAFMEYRSHITLQDGGVVTGGHMNVVEFVIPLFLIALICFILYMCFSLYCIFRKLKHAEHRFLHFLLNLLLYLATVIGTIPVLAMTAN